MNADQLRHIIVKPALEAIGLWSEAAENLVMGTAAQESHLEYVKQLNGPALGLFQMEPATYHDLWDSYLGHRPELASKIRQAIEYNGGIPPASRMCWDLRFAAIMCRIHYRRIPKALPDAEDIWALAAYWKKFYNTPLGAGTEAQFADNYRRAK